MPSNHGDQGLFEVEPGMEAASIPVWPKGPVDKTFRAFTPDQGFLLPPSLDEWLPAEHLARFVAELVDEHLDLSRILAGYTEGRGAPPYDPQLMVRVLIYGYTTGPGPGRALAGARPGPDHRCQPLGQLTGGRWSARRGVRHARRPRCPTRRPAVGDYRARSWPTMTGLGRS